LLGLNAVFHALPVLFMGMKIIGALFLLYIAFMIFRHAAEPLHVDESAPKLVNPFVKGFLTQVSNPKVMVFFGSIFVALLPAQVPLWMMLALIFIVSFNEVWWYTAVSLFFGSKPIRAFYLRAKVWIDRITGLFLGALGLRLLWSARETL
jgi:threonine/homoserine/homoserine lactone efflux protein